MGIGIPRVRLILPGDDHVRWVEIEEILSRNRVLFLSGVIDSTAASKIVRLLLLLDAQKWYEDIVIYINSRGGGARAAITIYDTMNTIRPEVCTAVMGLAASAASLVLTGGAAGRRVAFRHARVMIHQPKIRRVFGLPSILASEAEEMLELRNTIANIYTKTTKKPLPVVQQDLETTKFMSATEAKAYGIIDHIAKPTPKEDEDSSK